MLTAAFVVGANLLALAYYPTGAHAAFVDPVRNSTPMSDHPAEISGGAGPVAVWVIATDEEWQVARETFRLLETPRGASSFGSAADQSP